MDRDNDGVLTPADFREANIAHAPKQGSSPDRPADPVGSVLFKQEVHEILKKACFECHASNSNKVRGGLTVDSRAALLEGGVSGPAIIPGDPDASLLLEAVHHLDEDLLMPPDGKLSPTDISALVRWISLGAPWPDSGAGDPQAADQTGDSSDHDDTAKTWWAFHPLRRPATPVPNQAEWAWTDVDAFLLACMEEAGVSPVGDADRSAWLRRVTFDLTGLQPTPEELATFEEDSSAEAHEKVVDRLLASPRYGERWGRHWLDVARFAESSGNDSLVLYPHAWRYRDWVIEAFDRDLPFDQFLTHQLAGDLLPAEEATTTARRATATGYLALGPKRHKDRDEGQFIANVIDEQIDSISKGMLGLTIACARCHDHKADPITTADYYGIAGILLSTDVLYGTHRAEANLHPTALLELPTEAAIPNGRRISEDYRSELERRRFEHRRTLKRASGAAHEQGSPDARRLRTIRDQVEMLNDVLSRFARDGRALPGNRLAMGARDGDPRDAHLLFRGELSEVGPKIPRGFPEVLRGESPPVIDRGSGRDVLAQWVVSPSNPLTARVWANRVWGHLFGRGIVPTPNNFGASGQRPTHPELLDWLAIELIEGAWSTKGLIKTIVLSHAYRLSTANELSNSSIDPEVRLIWRMPARRLEAEALRDAVLFAGGVLDLHRPMGSLVSAAEGHPFPSRAIEGMVVEQKFRSVFLPVLRDRPPSPLECFDAADPSAVTGQREETTTALQALYLMNDAAVREAGSSLARRVLEAREGQAERIELAFQWTLSRRPTKEESVVAQRFLREFAHVVRTSAADDATDHSTRDAPAWRTAWSAFCHSLFQLAEFRYRG